MKISIGILAYNEADNIEVALQSIFQQAIFRDNSIVDEVEIIVIPNGCEDATSQVAANALEILARSGFSKVNWPKVNWIVHELDKAGKSYAWNIYIHELSSIDAKYCILMDADITLLNPQTLSQLIKTLEHIPEAWVSIDKPVKDITFKPQKTLSEYLSIAVSTLQGSSNNKGLCGQLYCGYSDKLRRIWMPVGLPAEDGFLQNMVLTNCFRSPRNDNHILFAHDASHSFRAYTKLGSLLRHEIRIVLGSTINSFIFDYLRRHSDAQVHAGTLIKQKNQDDPLWLQDLIQATLEQRGWWLVPSWFLLRRFRYLGRNSLIAMILKFPIACTAFLADLFVCVLANQKIRSQGGLGYW
jgi:glycosyltransferase involved in cell wall biosynthesis